MKAVRAALGMFCLMVLIMTGSAVPLSGRVLQNLGSNSVVGARVTLFTPDLRIFREQRTDGSGTFQFSYIAEGTYRLGVAALNYEYQERTVVVSNAPVTNVFFIGAE